MLSVPVPTGGRLVGVKGAERAFFLYQLEPAIIGLPQTASPSAGITNIDLLVKTDSYPKTIGFALNTTNPSDFIEVFAIDSSGNVVKKFTSTFTLATNVFTMPLADLRDAIPEYILPLNLTLRIAFHNVSGTSYLITAAWTIWIPTGT